MPQTPREPSQWSRKPQHIDTDPETHLAHHIRYEYRDANFVFACRRQTVSTLLFSDIWPIGTSYDFKKNLKTGDSTQIILPKRSQNGTFFAEGFVKGNVRFQK